MKILITGSAGFIGFHLCKKLLDLNYIIHGFDNLNTYYDVGLKKNRLKILNKYKKFKFKKINITNLKTLDNEFKSNKYDVVINLAAQAGVRNSIDNPRDYLNSNIIGFFNILELCKKYKIKHLIFASTSSVYGDNKFFPLKEEYNTDKPLNFYAATKKSNEVMAYSYSYIHKIKITGLRFFTVYGPFGRPDMALFKFTKSINESKFLNLFNNGNHTRDFTYIDDVTESILKIIDKPSKNKAPFQVYNIGSNNPKKLKEFLKIIEKILEKKSKFNNKPLQKGDIQKTHADISKLYKKINYLPKTSLNKGIKNFINWYKKYYV